MTTFKGTIDKENFPTSEQREDTTVTVPANLSKQRCEEAIFCPMSDRCDGTHCLAGNSDR